MVDSLTIPFQWFAQFKPPRARLAITAGMRDTLTVNIRRVVSADHVATLADVTDPDTHWARPLYMPIPGDRPRPRRIVFRENSYWREIGSIRELQAMINSDAYDYGHRKGWSDRARLNTDNPFNLPGLPLNTCYHGQARLVGDTELFGVAQLLGVNDQSVHGGDRTRRGLEEELGALREWDDSDFAVAAARVQARARSLLIVDDLIYQKSPQPVWSIVLSSEGTLTLGITPAFPREEVNLDDYLSDKSRYRLTGVPGSRTTDLTWLGAHNLEVRFNLSDEQEARLLLSELSRQTGLAAEVTGRAKVHRTPPLALNLPDDVIPVVAQELVRQGALLLPVLSREIAQQWAAIRDAWRAGGGYVAPQILHDFSHQMLTYVFNVPSFSREFPCAISQVEIADNTLLAQLDPSARATLSPSDGKILTRLVWARAAAFCLGVMPQIRRQVSRLKGEVAGAAPNPEGQAQILAT